MNQKKAQGFLLIILFVTCGILGILLANQIDPTRPGSKPTPLAYPTRTHGAPASGQTNIVLIRVDDLASAAPKLISVWIAFLGPADYPGLTVMALYPNPKNAEQVQQLEQSFALNADQSPSDKFWNQLAAFKFTWDGYILADATSITPILAWINNTNTVLNATAPATTESQTAVISEETVAFKAICSTLGNTSEIAGPAPDWAAIIPGHLRTDLTFEAMMYSWGKLNKPGTSTPCYILGNP